MFQSDPNDSPAHRRRIAAETAQHRRQAEIRPADAAFPAARARILAGDCPACRKTIELDSFRDELSVTEFRISGMCQSCQDDIFGGDDL